MAALRFHREVSPGPADGAQPAAELRGDSRAWYVDLLWCRGGYVYVGVTPDLLVRVRKHLAGTGAKFTRGHPPEKYLGAKRFASKGEALSMEDAIRRRDSLEKRALAARWLQAEVIVDLDQINAALAQACGPGQRAGGDPAASTG